jgi:transposase InsO family protein
MTSIPDPTLPQFDRPFRLFATEKRVLAQNAVGKLIDIGAIEHRHDGHCAIHLDVDAINTGPQPNPQSALRALVPKLNFDYLDGLFTAEANARFDGRLDMTDVTEFNVGGERLYLSPVLDLYNSEIVAYEIARRALFDMVGTMLKIAFSCLGPHDKPILHSDQGWQYQMSVYRKALQKHSVMQSMSRKDNCLDNAAMESFFGTSHDRIKLKLGGMSPVAYRAQFAQA